MAWDWQQAISLVIVVVTAGLLARSKFRRKFSFERDTHCGCAPAAARQTIVFRARKGERRQVVVKI
jgi:hypothetical protein